MEQKKKLKKKRALSSGQRHCTLKNAALWIQKELLSPSIKQDLAGNRLCVGLEIWVSPSIVFFVCFSLVCECPDLFVVGGSDSYLTFQSFSPVSGISALKCTIPGRFSCASPHRLCVRRNILVFLLWYAKSGTKILWQIFAMKRTKRQICKLYLYKIIYVNLIWKVRTSNIRVETSSYSVFIFLLQFRSCYLLLNGL